MSCWPAVVPLLTTKCLYWGWGCQGANRGVGASGALKGLHMENEDNLLQSTLENGRRSIADNRTWAQVNGTHFSTTLGHQMPLCGGIEGAYEVGVHLTKHHPDPQANDMSCWPAVVPLLTTRCLYWGGGVRGHWGLHMKNEDSLWQWTHQNLRWSITDNRTWAQVSGTQVCTILIHQMPLPGSIEGHMGLMGWKGTSDKASAWPTGWWHVMLTCSSTTLDH